MIEYIDYALGTVLRRSSLGIAPKIGDAVFFRYCGEVQSWIVVGIEHKNPLRIFLKIKVYRPL
jgi:hypothetical protein